jgi:S1-C subfamily serine protease
MRRKHLVIALAAVLVVAGTGVPGAASAGGTGQADSIAQADDGGDEQDDGSGAAACNYVDLYNQTIDSVVAIRTGSGLGSGFAYQIDDNDSNGSNTSYFVTSAHVVGDADQVIVQFARADSLNGTVVGTDELTDLAVVRVNGTPEYVEPLSASEGPPERGRRVAALGNPFGLDQTITHGIVSGTNRSMPTTRGFSIPNVVQTDAPINPGNSGGPLVTCEGTVVGVNTAGIAAQRAENVGFAVSSSLVNRVVPSLAENGSFEHSYLGVALTPITPQLAQANDLDETEGLYVAATDPTSPAADALQGATGFERVGGMRVPVGGDVLLEIDGRQISSTEELSSYLVTETRPGQTVTLTVLRDGERQQVEVTLAERPDPQATSAAG